MDTSSGVASADAAMPAMELPSLVPKAENNGLCKAPAQSEKVNCAVPLEKKACAYLAVMCHAQYT